MVAFGARQRRPTAGSSGAGRSAAPHPSRSRVWGGALAAAICASYGARQLQNCASARKRRVVPPCSHNTPLLIAKVTPRNGYFDVFSKYSTSAPADPRLRRQSSQSSEKRQLPQALAEHWPVTRTTRVSTFVLILNELEYLPFSEFAGDLEATKKYHDRCMPQWRSRRERR
jgi:hypothetical protein